MVATKFLPRTNEEIEAGITGQQHIERMLNKSLENLGMDYVDLYIYHMWDHRTPIYDILDGLNRMVKAGKFATSASQTVLPISWQKPTLWQKKKGLQSLCPFRVIII